MSKAANPGELKTKVYFKRIDRIPDDEGYPVEVEVNVFASANNANPPVKAKWVNAHGSDTFTAMQLQLRQPATITCRYSPKITEICVVYLEDDPEPFEIISIDNVENQHRWMEIKVQRKVASR